MCVWWTIWRERNGGRGYISYYRKLLQWATETVMLFLTPQCKVKAFTCPKESYDCSGSERKLSTLLHHYFDCWPVIPVALTHPPLPSPSTPPPFPFGNIWNYGVLTYIKCLCYKCNNTDISNATVTLQIKRRLGWSLPPWLSSQLTCQPVLSLFVRVPQLSYSKKHHRGIAGNSSCWYQNGMRKTAVGLSPFIPRSPQC